MNFFIIEISLHSSEQKKISRFTLKTIINKLDCSWAYIIIKTTVNLKKKNSFLTRSRAERDNCEVKLANRKFQVKTKKCQTKQPKANKK